MLLHSDPAKQCGKNLPNPKTKKIKNLSEPVRDNAYGGINEKSYFNRITRYDAAQHACHERLQTKTG